MTRARLCRAHRREMRKLQARVDKATSSDRVFFERHPDRAYRVRRAHTAEIRQEEIIQGERVVPVPGCGIFVAVKSICPGARLRLLVQGLKDSEVDLTEAEARDIFERMQTPEMRQIEAQMRATSCGGEAAS
jgi:hypothetical protein